MSLYMSLKQLTTNHSPSSAATCTRQKRVSKTRLATVKIFVSKMPFPETQVSRCYLRYDRASARNL